METMQITKSAHLNRGAKHTYLYKENDFN